MSIDSYDVEQMVRLFNIEFSNVVHGDGAVFTIGLFGVQVVFNSPQFRMDTNNWRCVVIDPTDDLEEKRFELLWELVKSGYFHYLRDEFPNTFRKMLTLQNYDRRLIEKRLDTFQSTQKYNYFRKINESAKDMSVAAILSAEPGFFDFLQE